MEYTLVAVLEMMQECVYGSECNANTADFGVDPSISVVLSVDFVVVWDGDGEYFIKLTMREQF